MAKVPAMLPAVETAKSRPAVLPTLVIERALKRTAIGVAVASTTLGSPKRAIVATSGFQRGPGSHSTTCSSTQPSTTGMSRIMRGAERERAEQEKGRREPIGEHAPEPVARGKPGQDHADQRAPDEDRAAEERRDDAAGNELEPEQHGTGKKDRGEDARGRPLDPHHSALIAVRLERVAIQPSGSPDDQTSGGAARTRLAML